MTEPEVIIFGEETKLPPRIAAMMEKYPPGTVIAAHLPEGNVEGWVWSYFENEDGSCTYLSVLTPDDEKVLVREDQVA